MRSSMEVNRISHRDTGYHLRCLAASIAVWVTNHIKKKQYRIEETQLAELGSAKHQSTTTPLPRKHSLELKQDDDLLQIRTLNTNIMKLNCIAIDDEPLGAGYHPWLLFKSSFRTWRKPLKMRWFHRIYPGPYTRSLFWYSDGELREFHCWCIWAAGHMWSLTTAYDSYDCKAFETDVMDYLLKPFHSKGFVKGSTKYMKSPADRGQYSSESISDHASGIRSFFVKTETRIEKTSGNPMFSLLREWVIWRIITTSKKIMSLLNYKNWRRSCTNQFVRVTIIYRGPR